MKLGDLAPTRRHAWEARWRERPSYRSPANRDLLKEWRSWSIEVDGRDIGTAAIGFGAPDSPTSAFIDDIDISPEHRGRGAGRAARELLIEWATGQGASELRATTTPSDPAGTRLFANFPIISRHLRLPVASVDRKADSTVVPMTAEAFPRWRDLMIDDFSTSFSSATNTTIDTARAQAEKLIDALLPAGVATIDSELWMIDDEGPAAYMWLHPRPEADEIYLQDVMVEETHRGKGLGRRIVSQAAESAARHGLSSVRLHVFADNSAANGLYQRLGYHAVAEHRRRSTTN